MDASPRIPLMDRVRLIGYGVIAGLVLGAILGWMAHGLIGFVVRFAIVIVLLVPLVLAVMFWRKLTARPAAPTESPVRDAEWVEIDASSRSRR